MKNICLNCGYTEERDGAFWNQCLNCLGDSYRKFAVTDVKTVKEFYERYYKPDRLPGQGADFIKNNEIELNERGWIIISHFDSITGGVVALFREQVQ